MKKLALALVLIVASQHAFAKKPIKFNKHQQQFILGCLNGVLVQHFKFTQQEPTQIEFYNYVGLCNKLLMDPLPEIIVKPSLTEEERPKK